VTSKLDVTWRGLAAAPLGRRLPTKLVMMLGSVPPVGLFLIFAFAHGQRWEILIAGAVGGLGFGIALSALTIVAAVGAVTCLLIPSESGRQKG
jgi:hypothetical protein